MDAPIYNPSVPYSGYINGGFRPGRLVRVQGSILPHATGFTINLQTGPNASHDDIGLHFNPRFHEHTVVRNAKNYGNWGAEERHGPSPFVPGQHFEVMIMSEPHQYKIAVNGQHFTEFNHRVPVDRIVHLVVEGDVTVSVIRFEGAVGGHTGSGYAPTGPPVTAGAPYPPSSAPPMGLVAPPYPPAGGSMYPPSSSPGYPSAPPPAYGAPAGYAPPAGHGYAPQPGYGGSPYPTQPGHAGNPGGYPPPQGQGYGYPSSPSGHQKSGGLLDNAGKLLAGGLAGVGLAKVANKIPGLGGHGNYGGQGGHGGQYGGHGHPGQAPGGLHGGGGGGGMLGGILGPAAALGAGGLLAGKGLKKQKKNKMLKYGLPLAGVGLGGYALSKGLKHKGHHYGGHSSSSSSSSSEEE